VNSKRKWIFASVLGAVFICICAAVACTAAGGLAFWQWQREMLRETPYVQATRSITIGGQLTARPSQTLEGHDPSPVETVNAGIWTPIVDTATAVGGGQDTLTLLENELVPLNDPIDLARRLEGKQDIPLARQDQPPSYSLGAEESFWVSNTDTNETFQIWANLRFASAHLYFWIENGVEYDEQALQSLGQAFESEIYPTNRELFGSEWTPGVDNDPHLYVVFARGLGSSVGGYYSSSDEYLPDAREYSNTHEMFLINADSVDLGDDYIYGTMAHEFQHMIHWYQDRNEEVWVSEGLSTLSQLLNGYTIGRTDFAYTSGPDLQLNTWPNTDDTFPHYGASFLFFSYFLDRFGEEAIMAVVSGEKNGLEGIDAVLALMHATDPQSGEPIGADDVFADWVIASYLNDPQAGNGRYAYRRYSTAPSPAASEEIDQCLPDWENREVKQYGVDYIRINCSGDFTLKFEGAQEVGVLPQDAYSGSYAFWSNKGDESDMTLTRTFDFSQSNGPLTLQYRAWYDLEKDFDYLYLAASTDGKNWQILDTPSGTEGDPTGNSFGWGYNGESGDWIEETVDISQYAGMKIQLRYEYVTDMAVNGEGFLLDDVRIPEIQYSENFETGDGGWVGNGFVRMQNHLPQRFVVSIIRNGKKIVIETVKLDAGQTASIPLQLGNDTRGAVLVVSGLTRFTIQPAQYRFRFEN
jgi:immune inhibitor A